MTFYLFLTCVCFVAPFPLSFLFCVVFVVMLSLELLDAPLIISCPADHVVPNWQLGIVKGMLSEARSGNNNVNTQTAHTHRSLCKKSSPWSQGRNTPAGNGTKILGTSDIYKNKSKKNCYFWEPVSYFSRKCWDFLWVFFILSLFFCTLFWVSL